MLLETRFANVAKCPKKSELESILDEKSSRTSLREMSSSVCTKR